MKRAFTLIELLVVIAIIAILAAILFPVFAQAKLAAKKSVDLSNIKQIALGIYMYTNDFDDVLPQTSWEQDPFDTIINGQVAPYNPQNPNGTYQIHWTYNIQPYIKNWNIFVNPADPTPVPTDNPCPNGTADVGKLDGSGHMYCDWAAQTNSYIPIYNAMPAHDWTVVTLSQYPSPSNQALVTTHRDDGIAADGHKGTSGFFPSQPCPNWAIVPLPACATTSSCTAAPGTYSLFTAPAAQAEVALTVGHTPAQNKKLFKSYDIIRTYFDIYNNVGSNYAFADGHAKYQTIGQVADPNNYEFGPTWLPNSQPWNTSPCN